MHLNRCKLNQRIIHKQDKTLDKKMDQQIKSGCNLDAILNNSLIHLNISKLDKNIIHKLDQKQINRSKQDAI